MSDDTAIDPIEPIDPINDLNEHSICTELGYDKAHRDGLNWIATELTFSTPLHVYRYGPHSNEVTVWVSASDPDVELSNLIRNGCSTQDIINSRVEHSTHQHWEWQESCSLGQYIRVLAKYTTESHGSPIKVKLTGGRGAPDFLIEVSVDELA